MLDLSGLHPKFRPIAEKWLHVCDDDLGLNIRVIETLRTPERQAQLQAKGLSQVKLGWHQYGLALDFACFGPDGAYLRDDRLGYYRKAGLVAEAFDCTWGGSWVRLKDLGHIEFHPGFTLDQYLAFLNGGPKLWNG